MPLNQFIEETMQVLGTDADEILVEAAKPLRNNSGPAEHDFVNSLKRGRRGALTFPTRVSAESKYLNIVYSIAAVSEFLV